MSDSDSFQQIATHLAGEPTDWTSEDFQRAHEAVRRFLMSRFRLVSADADDIASDVMLRFFQLQAEGRLDSTQNPASYLLRAAQWKGLDFLRRHQRDLQREVLRDPALMPETARDDEIAVALEENATVTRVRRALTRTREAGDHTAYSVVTSVLDEIDRTGSRPSYRATAAELGLSHTAVGKALERFHGYLMSEDEPID
jgi:DNA-directed RNA polymerase specialized sigma24 family protein